MILRILIVALLAAPLALAAYAIFIEPRRFRRVYARMRVPRISGGKLDVLHISDMHFMRGDRAKLAFLRRLQGVPLDAVVVTGDMIEEDAGIDYCVEALSGFKPALGVFAVFGSHDRWYSGLRNSVLDLVVGGYHKGPPNDFERLRRRLKEAGVVCLENESIRVELPKSTTGGSAVAQDLWIVGIGDMFVDLDDLDGALAGVPDDAFRILLTHTIESPEDLASHRFDAVFAGHSHGGQVRFPLIGPLITRSSLRREYASGVFEVAGTPFHINNGIGTGKWTGIRFMCPPEATHIEFVGRAAHGEGGVR